VVFLLSIKGVLYFSSEKGFTPSLHSGWYFRAALIPAQRAPAIDHDSIYRLWTYPGGSPDTCVQFASASADSGSWSRPRCRLRLDPLHRRYSRFSAYAVPRRDGVSGQTFLALVAVFWHRHSASSSSILPPLSGGLNTRRLAYSGYVLRTRFTCGEIQLWRYHREITVEWRGVLHFPSLMRRWAKHWRNLSNS